MARSNKLRSYSFYIIALLICGTATWWGVHSGALLENEHTQASHSVPGERTMLEAFDVFEGTVVHHLNGSTGLLLLQIIIILFAARFVGWLFNRMGQPMVIGEILAGILLGPSLLGHLWPEAFAWLFPHSSLTFIHLLSQFGLILFMFAIGMELSLDDVRKQARQATVISHAGILLPFALGVGLSYFTYQSYASHVGFLPYSLFVGVAMSITAFPVLARIIQERHLGQSHLGKLALNTAAMGDITAWLILAGVMAISVSGSMTSAIYNFGFLLIYVVVMFAVVRPVFRIVGKLYDNREVVSKMMVSFVFILLIISSFVTELLSMHALFGAFIMGLVMPENLKFRKIMTEKVEDVSLAIFLPLFFVSSGLETQLGLINSPSLWWLFALFTLVAIVGKVGGTYLAARATGEGKKESLYLGAFMNTRGLMELVVLAIGFDLGILPPVIFTILVLMTLVTTFMTTPLISLIDFCFRSNTKKRQAQMNAGRMGDAQSEGGRILISFGRASSGALLLQLAYQLLRRGSHMPTVTALHVTPDSDTNPIIAETYAKDCFAPIVEANEGLHLPLDTRYELSHNPEQMILDTVRDGGYSMLLVGAGLKHSQRKSDCELMDRRKSLRRRIGALSVLTTESLMAAGSLLRDKMDFFCKNANSSVGILIDRDFGRPERILLIAATEEDLRMLPYGRVMAENNNGKISILPLSTHPQIAERLRPGDNLLTVTDQNEEISPILQDYDFLIISYVYWQTFAERKDDVLQHIPSTLILDLK